MTLKGRAILPQRICELSGCSQGIPGFDNLIVKKTSHPILVWMLILAEHYPLMLKCQFKLSLVLLNSLTQIAPGVFMHINLLDLYTFPP